MLIEIRGTAFINKGAELMLHAILQKMRSARPDARFAMTPYPPNAAPYRKRAALELYQKAWVRRFRIQWGALASLLPAETREAFGIVLDKEINIVLDASGFAYSDQWGADIALELARSCSRWKKQGTRVILLPQAFGPFSTPRIRDAFRKAADHIDLIFARDKISYRHLLDILGERPNIKIAPDFTNLIEGVVPETFDKDKHRFCIVPNYRMVDMTSRRHGDAYLPFLVRCTRRLLERDQAPFLLIHEGADDLLLARKIAEAVKVNIPIIEEENPLRIKGILGSCRGVVGSRFHGLASALSQGVPALATSWSHKYKMLFEEYGFDDGLMDVLMDGEAVDAKIDMLIDPESKERIRKTLCERSLLLKRQSEAMWADVLECIDGPGNNAVDTL